MDTGDVILSQLTGKTEVSLTKVEHMISGIDVEFDQDAIKSVNEICKCAILEGANSIEYD